LGFRKGGRRERDGFLFINGPKELKRKYGEKGIWRQDSRTSRRIGVIKKRDLGTSLTSAIEGGGKESAEGGGKSLVDGKGITRVIQRRYRCDEKKKDPERSWKGDSITLIRRGRIGSPSKVSVMREETV